MLRILKLLFHFQLILEQQFDKQYYLCQKINFLAEGEEMQITLKLSLEKCTHIYENALWEVE